MNQDLLQQIEKAIEACKTDGIDIRDHGLCRLMEVAQGAKTLGAQNPHQAIRRIQLGGDRYRYIPLEGVRLSLLGSDIDGPESTDWYTVERPDGYSFAISHNFVMEEDHGARCCDLSQIPEYLLLPKKEKAVVKAI